MLLLLLQLQLPVLLSMLLSLPQVPVMLLLLLQVPVPQVPVMLLLLLPMPNLAQNDRRKTCRGSQWTWRGS